MNHFIRRERHHAVFDFAADFAQTIIGLLSVLRPFGKVQVLASVIDVICYEPGDGRNVTVPGPARVVRVAVVAGALEDACDLRRHMRVRFYRPGAVYYRIGLRRSRYELQDYE